MREKNGAAAGVRLQALQNMLEESVVSAPLGWRPEEVSSVFVVFKGAAVPLFDGVGRIGQHQIKTLQLPVFDKAGVLQRVIVYDMEVLNAVEEEIHAPDGAGKLVDLLSVDLEIPPFFSLIFQVGNAGDEHACAAAGGINLNAVFDTKVSVNLRARQNGKATVFRFSSGFSVQPVC